MKNWLSCCFPGKKEEIIKEHDFVDVDAKKDSDQLEIKENIDEKEEKRVQDEAKEIEDKEKDNLKNSKKNEESVKKEEETSNSLHNNNEIKNNKPIEEVKQDDPVGQIIQSNRKIQEEEVNSAGKVILEEEECKLLGGKKVEITAAGMIGGRGLNDGVVIFGKPPVEEDQSKETSQFKYDFELNYEEKLKYPYIFSIYYQKEDKNFYIRSYAGIGSDNRILFVKLTGSFGLPITQKEIISAGSIIFQITPLDNNCLEVINLSRKELSVMPKQNFDASSKKEVTIGRHKNCDFSFPKDKSFSRCQATLEFDEEIQKWVLHDGAKDKPSTNGTWVFGTHSFKIYNDMHVEILNSKIKISLVKEEK